MPELTITPRERAEIEAANLSALRPVVFIHGLWLHSTSWLPWAQLFLEAGYAPLLPGWPGDPETVDASREHPERFAGVGVEEAARYYGEIIRMLQMPPLIIGHSFGGLLAQRLLGEGLGAGAVAIDAAPFRGVLPLPMSALKVAFPVLRSPGNRHRAVSLTPEQFRYAFANAVSPLEAAALYEAYAIPASGRPLFQAAAANLNPRTPAKVNVANNERGPLLLISGEMDHTVPAAVVNAEVKLHQRRSKAITEHEQVPGRGHSLTIDSGWAEIAQRAIAFGQRYVN
jgi:pimeloyl-ACP methyl ester carboxylesterase